MTKPNPDLTELHWRVIFEMSGNNAPAQLAIMGPYRDAGGQDEHYQVSLVYRNLSATWPVFGIDPARFLAFFEELARDRRGWQGVKKLEPPDCELSIACEYQGHNFRPDVWATVRLATDSCDPYWTVELRLELWPESLDELAQRARSFFGTRLSKREPGQGV
jgi:hypothetical protein